MCGIAGLIGPLAQKVQLGHMLDRIYHRGPDGEGEFIDANVKLGMRRLAVIDIEHGWQPLKSRNDRVIVFQNGEIYNYRLLRDELTACGYDFATHSDTEVLGHGYDAWGWEGLLRRIDGMYAIAILDRDTRILHLARDRFGEKPLFYAENKDCFAYSSSLKSLATLSWIDLMIDPQALDRYLALHYVPGDHTIFQGIKRLSPGCSMHVPVDAPKPTIYRYYQTKLTHPRPMPTEVIIEAVEKAIESRLVADVPVGVFLSGGIDSSIIAALAVRQNQEIATYSIGFPDTNVDESQHAEAVARHIGSKHYTFHFDHTKFAELLPQVAAALDEPIGDQATLPLFWLCREARKSVTVVLSGEGGDELFGGYGYYGQFVSSVDWPQNMKWLLDNQAELVAPLFGPSRTASGFPIIAGKGERCQMLGDEFVPSPWAWEEETSAWLNTARNTLQRATAADIASWLPDDLLVKLDRIAMAHSLEGRAPFLTPELAEMAMNLVPQQRAWGDQTKIALREVARRLLPRGIVDRPKQGFVLPMRKWLQEWFAHQEGVKQYVANAALPGLDATIVAQIIDKDLKQGVLNERLLFALVMLIEWWKHFK